MVILSAQNVVKQFGTSRPVVNGVDVEIRDGEYVSIIGRSGSGKSTLLRLLCGLEPADNGRIVVDGHDLGLLRGKELSLFRSTVIGVVFQDNNLIQDFSVRDNILTPMYISRRKVDDAYYQKLLRLVGLAQHENKRPCQLSGGMQQRAAIARALIAKPKIIFADEPTGSLDIKTEDEIIKLFQDINTKLGTTILQVTHSDACVRASSRIITICDGKIVDERKEGGS